MLKTKVISSSKGDKWKHGSSGRVMGVFMDSLTAIKLTLFLKTKGMQALRFECRLTNKDGRSFCQGSQITRVIYI